MPMLGTFCSMAISMSQTTTLHSIQMSLDMSQRFVGNSEVCFSKKYFSQIQLPMTSVTSITKEKTAKIIPNAIAVATATEKHIFTSFISRDQTFNLIHNAWKKALERSDMHPVKYFL